MARFRLEREQDEAVLGEIVLQLAEVAASGGERAALEGRLRGLIAFAPKEKIEIVYDSPERIHIVIPDLRGANVYSGNRLANEAMGHITMRGCGK